MLESDSILFWQNQVVASEYNELATIFSIDAKLQSFVDNVGIAKELDAYDNLISNEEVKNSNVLANNLFNLIFLSDANDRLGCYLKIQTGAGGRDATDWTERLLEMYQGFVSSMKWKCSLTDETLNSVTLKIDGRYSYGYLKHEEGNHRVIRFSEFDSGGKRHTSFAGVTVIPQIDDKISIELKTSDYRKDTFRGSGPGGQHKNKTDSAVRLTHYESGVVVQCQSERDQHQNLKKAIQELKSRLYQIVIKEKAKKREEDRKGAAPIAFGAKTKRTYEMHPNKRVNDHVASYKSNNLTSVLAGDIMPFIIETIFRT